MNADRQFVDLICRAWYGGHRVNPRNGERRRVFAPPAIRFDSTPLVSIRKTAWKSAIREFEWFLSGSSNVNDLHPSVRKWWEPWASEAGYVRFNYGEQLRAQTCDATDYSDINSRSQVGSFDQIAAFVKGIREKPHSARHVISTWYSPEMYSEECPITNCHGTVIQAQVNDGVLDLFTYQRSADLICGLPHNWIQYWAFLQWLAVQTGNRVGELVWQGGDVHVYAAHEAIVEKIVGAASVKASQSPPQLIYSPTSDRFAAHDFALSGVYEPIVTDAAEMVV